ncbi:MAG: zf-HC2 domain-containing protein [Actinomycetota bacterium]|nr:zf-HC2 domain-containing protein [Actinomycetota bacterium]
MNREEYAGDIYRDWDAAYVLGSLVPSERHDFELHLAGCAECSSAVAELAGVPGILAGLPAYEALSLAGGAGDEPGMGRAAAELPGTVLSGFAAKVKRRRLRNAALAAALAVGTAAAAAGVTIAVNSPGPAVQIKEAGSPLRFTAVTASPITAVGSIRSVGWGTQLDWTCTYAGATSGAVYPIPAAGSRPYLLVVTDTAGRETVAASWTAGAGSVVSPTATVGIPLDHIRSVEIRWANTGTTALRADLPATS